MYLSHLWRIHSNFSHVWQIRANSSHVWHIHSNVKVKRICHKCEKFKRICHTFEEFVRFFPDVTNTCKSSTSVKDSREFFTTVIRTHDMCDKFLQRVFLMRSYSRPVLWKEKCWGDIRLFLMRLHSNPSSSFWGDAITRKIKDGRWRSCLSTDRNSFWYLHN